MILIKEFEFDSAHFLPEYKGKCEALHGHTYKLVVKLDGHIAADGMIMDFVEFKNIVNTEVLDVLDHTCINDIIKQPTAENMAVWVWDKLEKPLGRGNCRLFEVELWETKTSGVVYRGEQG